MASSKLGVVQQFFETLNITMEPCIEVRQVPDDSEHMVVYANSDVAEGELLACIPKDAVLSMVNTAAADILRMSDLRGGLALNFAVLYEKYVMGPMSRWHGYLQSVPPRAYLPIFWTQEEAALLQGTEAEGRAAADAPLLVEDFSAIEALLVRHPGIPRRGFTLANYMAAASWLASRGFGVDDVHGYSLVPLADIFNHKAAFVRLTDDFVVAGEATSSDSDGGGSGGEDSDADDSEADSSRVLANEADDNSRSDGEASERSPQPGSGAKGVETEGTSSEDEDSAAGQPWRPRIRQTDAAEDPRWRLEIGILSSERAGVEVLEILAASDLAAGAEVRNCYGELSSCELVVKYGFALEADNPFDNVSVEPDSLTAAAQRHLGKAAARKRVAFLNAHSDLLSEPQDSLCIAPAAVLEAGLVAALWVLFAPAAAMAGADSMEEVAVRLAAQLAAAAGAKADSQVEQAAAQKRNDSELQSGGKAAGAAAQQPRGGTPAAQQPDGGAAAAGDAPKDRKPTISRAAASTANGTEEEPDDGEALLSSVPVAQAVAALPPAAAAALADAVRRRLQRYRHEGLAQDEAALAAAKREPTGEAKAAKLAALTLVVAEKRILMDALTAIETAWKTRAAESSERRKDLGAGGGTRQTDGGPKSKRARQ